MISRLQTCRRSIDCCAKQRFLKSSWTRTRMRRNPKWTKSERDRGKRRESFDPEYSVTTMTRRMRRVCKILQTFRVRVCNFLQHSSHEKNLCNFSVTTVWNSSSPRYNPPTLGLRVELPGGTLYLLW